MSPIIAHGTVRDTKGRPVAGAKIIVEDTTEVLMRADWAGPRVYKTTTDAAGRYSVSTTDYLHSAIVFVQAADKPVTWAYASTLHGWGQREPTIEARYGAPQATDIVLREETGTLEMYVLGPDGKPAAGMDIIVSDPDHALSADGRDGSGRLANIERHNG